MINQAVSLRYIAISIDQTQYLCFQRRIDLVKKIRFDVHCTRFPTTTIFATIANYNVPYGGGVNIIFSRYVFTAKPLTIQVSDELLLIYAEQTMAVPFS